MSVRRLAPKELQPASFAFTEENLAWAKTQIAKFPEGRQASAVISILWRVQEQHEGWVPEPANEADDMQHVQDFIEAVKLVVTSAIEETHLVLTTEGELPPGSPNLLPQEPQASSCR